MRCLQGVSFVRPLMGVGRSDVESYLKGQKILFCTDSTNRLMKYERNKVRRDLLPLLAKEYNPQIIHVLSDLAASAGEDYDFISLHARRQFEKTVTVSRQKLKLNLKGIRRQHPAILRLVLRQMAECLTKAPSPLTFEHIRALEDLAVQEDNSVLDLPGHLKAVKTREFLELYYIH